MPYVGGPFQHPLQQPGVADAEFAKDIPTSFRRLLVGASGDNPLGRIFEEMLGGGRSRQAPPEPRARTEPQARPTRKKTAERPKNPYDDLFGQMFETGARQRDEYQKGMESIFEQFTRGMDRHR